MVADGVGGWGELDVDPGLFSKHLTKTVKRLYEDIKPHEQPGLKHILVESVKLNPHMGSSTAVMVQIEPKSNEIVTCNLGDSAYLILRCDGADQL
jgi:protein phosphatase PTC7